MAAPAKQHPAAPAACAGVAGRAAVALDAFAGCGGNTLALAQTCRQVLAVDIDEQNARAVLHNAGVYGVAGRVHAICGDFFAIVQHLQVRGALHNLTPQH